MGRARHRRAQRGVFPVSREIWSGYVLIFLFLQHVYQVKVIFPYANKLGLM